MRVRINTRMCHLSEMEKIKARPTYTYKMADARISRESEEKDLRVFLQDYLSPKKHINKTFGGTLKSLKNMGVAFH